MKVLFLDVDGVLVNRASVGRGPQGVTRINAFCANLLGQVLRETGAKVVLSSVWRLRYSPERFNKEIMEPWGLPPVVIGRTRSAQDTKEGLLYKSEPRGHQIKDWLAEHPEVTSWAVVDDDSDMDRIPPLRFVQTNFELGLQGKHADLLIKVLNTPVIPESWESAP